MTLQTQTFDEVVQSQATAVQGSAAARYLTDFSEGSILRAVIEASSAVVMWLQALILQLLTTTRAATSVGSDLDSWMADYGLTRLAAVAATGQVTFARFTPSAQAIVPIGAIVQTTDGTQQFMVIADTTQAAYTPAGYVLPVSTASITATVQAVTPGSAANVAIGVISALGQSISGVDTVTNAAAFVSGEDAESDVAFRARFVNYLSSLAKATKQAIGYAITSIQDGLTYTLTEDYTYSGSYQPGYFYVVVDDGSGYPPSGLLSTITSAIDAVRACGISFGVFPPTPIMANVGATILTGPAYTHSLVAASVEAALDAYIAALPMGTSLAWSRLYQIAYNVAGVTEVTSLTLNSASTDIAATAQNAIIPGTVIVS